MNDDTVPATSPRAQWLRVAFRLAVGQAASLATASTGVFVTLLVQRDASVPVLQSLCAYCAIFIVFSIVRVARLLRSGKGVTVARVVAPVFFRWWRYAVIAIFDFGANSLVVWAYAYTDLISIQLLDCFTIPCVMLFAIPVFRRIPTRLQIAGAVLSLLGLGLLVLLDSVHDTSTSSTPNPLLGDCLCLAASVCYAISNTACEALLKVQARARPAVEEQDDINATAAVEQHQGMVVASSVDDDGDEHNDETAHMAMGYDSVQHGVPTDSFTVQPTHDEAEDTVSAVVLSGPDEAGSTADVAVEYLVFVSFFGACLASIAAVIVRDSVSTALHRMHHSPAAALAQAGFAVTMVVVYTSMPALFAVSSATFANLSLLTADVYAIVLNLICFGQSPQPLFVVPFIIIVSGLIVYERVVDWRNVWHCLVSRLCGK